MSTYIATFFSHFGAVRFRKELDMAGIGGLTCTLMPVPRFLSSSCGTCVKIECENDQVSESAPVRSENPAFPDGIVARIALADGVTGNTALPFPISHPDEIEQIVLLTGGETFETVFCEDP